MDNPADPHGFKRVDEKIDVQAAIHSITDRQRAALGLAIMGLTEEEIGQQMGITQQAASKHVAAAVANLNKAINGERL